MEAGDKVMLNYQGARIFNKRVRSSACLIAPFGHYLTVERQTVWPKLWRVISPRGGEVGVLHEDDMIVVEETVLTLPEEGTA